MDSSVCVCVSTAFNSLGDNKLAISYNIIAVKKAPPIGPVTAPNAALPNDLAVILVAAALAAPFSAAICLALFSTTFSSKVIKNPGFVPGAVPGAVPGTVPGTVLGIPFLPLLFLSTSMSGPPPPNTPPARRAAAKLAAVTKAPTAAMADVSATYKSPPTPKTVNNPPGILNDSVKLLSVPLTILINCLPNSWKTPIIESITLGSLKALPANSIILLTPLKIDSNASTKNFLIVSLVSGFSNILPIAAIAPAIKPPVNNNLKKLPLLSKNPPPEPPPEPPLELFPIWVGDLLLLKNFDSYSFSWAFDALKKEDALVSGVPPCNLTNLAIFNLIDFISPATIGPSSCDL